MCESVKMTKKGRCEATPELPKPFLGQKTRSKNAAGGKDVVSARLSPKLKPDGLKVAPCLTVVMPITSPQEDPRLRIYSRWVPGSHSAIRSIKGSGFP